MPRMTKIPQLPGVHKTTARGHTYWYAWRGGPRLPSPKEDPAGHIAAYQAAKAAQAALPAPTSATVGDIVKEYRAKGLPPAASTQRNYRQQLEHIDAYFGTLPLAALASAKMPAKIRTWRDSRAATPRSADYGVEVLSSMIQWAIRYGHATVNPAHGIESIHRADRAHIIWTEQELPTLIAAATPECARALIVAAYTGLRMGDLVSLTWNEIDFEAGLIDRATNKSGGRTRAYPPLLDEARVALRSAPKRHVVALTSGLGRPWTTSGLGNAFRDARNAIGVRKRFHDLRGTAATRFVMAGYGDEDVAAFMGWEVEDVKAIKRRYVTGKAVALAAVEKLRRKET